MQVTHLQTLQEVIDLFVDHNLQSQFVVFDIETTGLNDHTDSCVEMQFSGVHPDSVYLAPFDGIDWNKAFANLHKPLIGHNLRFDIKFLYRKGVNLSQAQYRDTLLLAHLANENLESYSLGDLVLSYFKDNYKKQFWDQYKTYLDAPEDVREIYGAKDIVYTRRLYETLMSSLTRQHIPASLIEHVHRLQYALLQTEIHGVRVDMDYIQDLGVKTYSRIQELDTKMRSLAPLEINNIEMAMWVSELNKRKTEKGKANVPRPIFSFDSSKQLQNLLYSELQLPVQKNDKTKAISVDEKSLKNLEGLHPLINSLLEFRELSKIQGTYIEGTLERMINGRIYPEFRVNGTVTGRISHSNPNLGQMPRNGGIRGIYIPDPGNVFISADYSQLEVCIEANITNDPNLKKIFTEGLSKHDMIASKVGIDRNTAKTLNFALQYGASEFKVAKILSVDIVRAKEVWDNYWDLYSGAKRLKAKTDNMVNKGIPLNTIFGRQRRFEAKKRQPWDGDYRQAYNFIIQSTGADITSQAFYEVADWLKLTGYGRALVTVHDEIIIEVKREYAEICETVLIQTMVSIGNRLGFKIPLKAESSGPMLRWED